MISFIYEMTLDEAKNIVNDLAKERCVSTDKIISEYLKYRNSETFEAPHFWANQNSACYKIVNETNI